MISDVAGNQSSIVAELRAQKQQQQQKQKQQTDEPDEFVNLSNLDWGSSSLEDLREEQDNVKEIIKKNKKKANSLTKKAYFALPRLRRLPGFLSRRSAEEYFFYTEEEEEEESGKQAEGQ